jgi:hypothetical protein
MAALDRLRKDAEARVERAKEEVRNQINEQLENTTKRTILENERLAAELGYQSRQTEKLLKRQQLLLDEATELRRQLQVSSKTQDAMARRNHAYQKTIKTLVRHWLADWLAGLLASGRGGGGAQGARQQHLLYFYSASTRW